MPIPKWIPVDRKVATCDKTIALDIKLGMERTWSFVVELWIECAEHHQNGRIEGPHAAAIVAKRAGWKHDPEKFVRAMVEARWLDETPEGYAIHGWEKPGHTGAHIVALEAKSDKVKAWRKAKNTAPEPERNDNVTGNVPVTDEQRTGTVLRKMERETEREKNPHGRTLLITGGGGRRGKVILGPKAALFVASCAKGLGHGLVPLVSSDEAGELERRVDAHGGPEAATAYVAAACRRRDNFDPQSVKLLLDMLGDPLPTEAA